MKHSNWVARLSDHNRLSSSSSSSSSFYSVITMADGKRKNVKIKWKQKKNKKNLCTWECVTIFEAFADERRRMFVFRGGKSRHDAGLFFSLFEYSLSVSLSLYTKIQLASVSGGCDEEIEQIFSNSLLWLKLSSLTSFLLLLLLLSWASWRPRSRLMKVVAVSASLEGRKRKIYIYIYRKWKHRNGKSY